MRVSVITKSTIDVSGIIVWHCNVDGQAHDYCGRTDEQIVARIARDIAEACDE